MRRFIERIHVYLFSFFGMMGLFSCQSEMDEFMKSENSDKTISTKAGDLVEKSVEVKVAGTLSKQLTADEMKSVEKLVISGFLNAADVPTFRKMLPELKVLDLKKVTFVEVDTLYYHVLDWSNAYKIEKNAISECMFYSMKKLKSIILPENVTKLCNSAFAECSELEIIGLPKVIKTVGEAVFRRTKIKEIDLIPFNMLGDYMFEGCSNLTSVKLPPKLEMIPRNCFTECSSLTTIDIPSSVVSIGLSAFDRSGLTSIDIPSSVVSIERQAFMDCSKLESVKLSVADIKNRAFYRCTNLKNIEFPDGLATIGSNDAYYIFAECTSLESVTIPTSVTAIHAYAFFGCTKLKEVNLSEGLGVIGGKAFQGCASLKSINIPSSVYSIGDYSFESSGLENIVMLDKKDIDLVIYELAFRGCKFETILLPNKLKAIGSYAFSENSMLKTITIPSSVNSFGSNVLLGCNNITSIFWNSTIKVSGMGPNPNCLLYLSSEAVDTSESGLINIIVNGTCAKLTLVDGRVFECPQEFKTQEVVFTRNFQKTTVPGKSNGWYGLSLPFDVDKITYNGNELTPFNQTNKSGLHFWLRTLTETGYKDVEKIEKNKAYIIAMPNNSNYYDEEYNVHGNVTFTVKNSAGITIPKNISLAPQKGPDYSLIGTFTSISKRASAYPINDAGTAFQASIRDVSPFEAYAINHSLNSSVRSFTIGSGSQTRSYHPIGRKPSITDM